MRRILKVVTVAAGVLLMAGSAFAASVFALEAGVRGMYWGSTISGDVADDHDWRHPVLDLKSDLGMKDENIFIRGGVPRGRELRPSGSRTPS